MAGRFSDSAWHRKPATSRRSVRVLLLVLGLAIAGLIAGPLSSAIQSGLSPTSSPARVTESGLTSWNPHVSCSADLVTIRDVLGPAYPTQTVNGSRYQTNSTAGHPPRTSPVAAVHDHEQDGYRAVLVRPDQRSLPVRLWHQDHRLLRMVLEAERRWPVSQQPNVLHECRTDHHNRHHAWLLENRNRSGLVGERLLRCRGPVLQ